MYVYVGMSSSTNHANNRTRKIERVYREALVPVTARVLAGVAALAQLNTGGRRLAHGRIVIQFQALERSAAGGRVTDKAR